MNRKLFVLVIVVLPALVLALAGGAAAEPSAPQTMSEKIVFSSTRLGSQQDIYVMNPDGSNQTRLTNTREFEIDPDWSPDGTKIAFARQVEYAYEIFVMNADGSGQTRLTHLSDAMAPDWSPDGMQIAFVKANEGVFVMNADGSNLRQLTFMDVESVAWSPDGTRIAFDNSGNVTVMDIDGNNQTSLTNDSGFEGYPAWSPDASKIAYTDYNYAGSGEIIVMNADGSNHIRLTNSLWGDAYPAWSPDGTNIVYESRDDVVACLRVMDADGANKACISIYAFQDYSPDWQAVQGNDWPKTFLPPDDSYVVQSKPNRSFGSLKLLRINHTATDINSYLKFRIGSLDSFNGATLRLYVTDPGTEAAVYAVSPYYRNTTTAWREGELKWTNAPSIGGTPLGILKPVKKGRWVEVDVTNGVQEAIAGGRDEVSFAIVNSSRNLIVFASKNEVRHAPQLVIVR